MRIFTVSRVAGVAVAVLAVLSGCSLLRDLNADQCETDSECQTLGPKFAGRICLAGVCQSTGSGSGGAGGNGTGGTGGAVDPNACTTSKQCLDKSFNSQVCINAKCVDLLSPDCPIVLPRTDDLYLQNLNTTNPIILGAFANVPDGSLFGIQSRNYDLSLTELTRQATGLPGAGGKSRGVVTVVCRSNFMARANLEASLDHLVDDLHVPGIVAGLLADDLQHAFEYKGADNSVFFLSPLESDSALLAVQDQGLMWHMLPGGGSVADSYAPLLNRTLTYLAPSGNARVALVTASDLRYTADISDTVTKQIRFNGKTAAQNGTDFKSVAITSIYADPNADLTAQIQMILAFQPHVIIASAADEFLSKMVPAIEDGWDAAASSADAGAPQHRPFYLLSPYHVNNPALPALLAGPRDSACSTATEALGSPNCIHKRLVGVNTAAAADTTLYDAYQIKFDTLYPDVQGQSKGYENFYDSGYFMIYATAAAGTASVASLSGTDIARGMKRLLAGNPYSMGENIPNAISALASNSQATITLNGALGPPDFDPLSGARLGPGSVWCIDSGLQSRFDVLRFDAVSMDLTGTWPAQCIPGF